MNGRSIVAAALAVILLAPAGLAEAQTTTGARAEESRTLALAVQMERSGQPGEAERVLIELLSSYPTAAGALSMLAQLGADRGAPDLVLPYAEAAAERAGYDQATIHQVLIRALADSGLTDEALERARAWVDARPLDTVGYSELASALTRLGRRGDAISVLVDARGTTGDADLFSQELAILYLAEGDTESAAGEWLRVLAWGDVGVTAVEAHVNAPGVEAEVIVPAIERALGQTSVAMTTRIGGLELALRLERPEWSRELAERLAGEAPFEMRWQLLRKYYLDTRDRGYVTHARWAASRLAAESTEAADRLQWETVEAGLAVDQGDEDHAAIVFARVLEQSDRGSETRRVSLQNLVILGADADPREAERLIEIHAAEFPEREADLAAMAIQLSKAYVGRGDLGAARRSLDLGPSQPADASTAARLSAQRGYLALFEGDVGGARSFLETAGLIPGGNPAERTEVLLLLDVLGQADSAQVAVLGKGIYALQSAGDSAPLLRSTDRWATGSGGAGAPGLMRLAASALERAGSAGEAESVRLALVSAYPRASETPGALLALAREAMPARADEARTWLERLVIDHPESALAPVARRLLSELDRGASL
jgi:tetratricopeptide (TPR) repeat protein